MHSIRKVKVLKRYIKQIQQVYLLFGNGETSTVDYKTSENVSNFLQTICYYGLETKGLVEPRVRLCTKIKIKAPLTLPPDLELME